MIDSYLQSAGEAGLKAFCAGFKNVIGPCRGRSAVAESADDEGNIVPAREAVGDPDLWYACVRSRDALTLPDGIEACGAPEGEAVLGAWA